MSMGAIYIYIFNSMLKFTTIVGLNKRVRITFVIWFKFWQPDDHIML